MPLCKKQTNKQTTHQLVLVYLSVLPVGPRAPDLMISPIRLLLWALPAAWQVGFGQRGWGHFKDVARWGCW